MDQAIIIMELYYELQREIKRTMPNIKGPFSIISDYAKTLSNEKRDMLFDIRDFRNHCAFDSHQPQLPGNYQEWIDFLKTEIANLKTKKF